MPKRQARILGSAERSNMRIERIKVFFLIYATVHINRESGTYALIILSFDRANDIRVYTSGKNHLPNLPLFSSPSSTLSIRFCSVRTEFVILNIPFFSPSFSASRSAFFYVSECGQWYGEQKKRFILCPWFFSSLLLVTF